MSGDAGGDAKIDVCSLCSAETDASRKYYLSTGRIKMIQIVLKIDGMVCGMCEIHINDAIRRAFPVKKLCLPTQKDKQLF